MMDFVETGPGALDVHLSPLAGPRERGLAL